MVGLSFNFFLASELLLYSRSVYGFVISLGVVLRWIHDALEVVYEFVEYPKWHDADIGKSLIEWFPHKNRHHYVEVLRVSFLPALEYVGILFDSEEYIEKYSKILGIQCGGFFVKLGEYLLQKVIEVLQE